MPPEKRQNGGPVPAAKRPTGESHLAYGSSPEEFPEDDIDQFIDEELASDNSFVTECSNFKILDKWRRPCLKPIRPANDDISFQQLSIDYLIMREDTAYSDHDGKRKLSTAPVIRMFGVTEEGNSVLAFVHGFQPYFYISCPQSVESEEEIERFRRHLNSKLERTSKGEENPVRSIEVVEKQSIWNYHGKATRRFLKLIMALPSMVSTARGILERGLELPGQGVQQFVTFESNVLFNLRFMIDTDIVGGNWVTIPKGEYRLRGTKQHPQKSECQIEIDVFWDKVTSQPLDGKYSRLAPLRILSVDIECAGRKGSFPEAEKDPVIQIASIVSIAGRAADEPPLMKSVLTLDTCAPIIGVHVVSCKTEKELLLAWRDLVVGTDPDVIIGYNILNFDLPYLLDRAKAINVHGFSILGRTKGCMAKMSDATFSSRAYGVRESKEVNIDGRVNFDLLQAVQRDYKLASYSLNAVSAKFLGEQKEDVHHSIITDLQNGTPETRRRLAVYCVKDAYLPQRLLDKLMFMYNYIEMARVTGVPFDFLLSRGQSIKVMSQILRKARKRGMLIPKVSSSTASETYEGATVLEATTGLHETPVATLDFASLYPSIMMAHNLCYCTLVPKKMEREFPPESVTRSPCGDVFVKPDLMKGILPEILEELIGARKRAKKDIKNATDPIEKAVLDGRQLALKVSANSVYGFTGATVGKLPCLEISSSVTAFGRKMIEHTKDLVVKKYAGAKVIYGDTDSVMINFGTQLIEERLAANGAASDITSEGKEKRMLAELMKLGSEAADYVSETFPKPIKLEFEKIYYPYLLISKKRYAGLLWTTPEKWDKMDSKGIETVRRDNCLLVKDVVETSLRRLLIDRNIEGAVKYCQGRISELLRNQLDISLLVITKGLTQDADKYDSKQAHTELTKKMRRRDPATAPSVGDRVPYVIIQGPKGAKTYEKAEDPIYALDHNIPIDANHYLEHHLKQPLMRIFEPVLKDKAESTLWAGEHMRTISIATPSGGGGLMRFTKKQFKCLGCKALIPEIEVKKGNSTLCRHCREEGKASDLYIKSVLSVRNLEDQFSRLWTQCQRCQESLHQDVLCTSRDCPIFYRRKKVQRDLHEAHEQLARW